MAPTTSANLMQSLGMNDPTWRKLMLTLVIICVVLVAAISILLMLRYLPPRKDEAAILYTRFTRSAGLEPATGESPLDYALRISEEKAIIAKDAASITEQYLDARYGPPDPGVMSRFKLSVQQFAGRY